MSNGSCGNAWVKLCWICPRCKKLCRICPKCYKERLATRLNSLSNKLSGLDYRCEVTCEIFKDYTIGVIIWNETFASKERERETERVKTKHTFLESTITFFDLDKGGRYLTKGLDKGSS